MTSQPNIIIADALAGALSTSSLSWGLTGSFNLFPDYTPNAVNWTTLNTDGVTWQAESQQFTGINRTITVMAAVTSGDKTLCYFKKGTSNLTGFYSVGSTPASNGYTLIASATPSMISIALNDWLTFAAFPNPGFPATQTCTVTNQTTGGGTLDTLTLTNDVGGGEG